MGLKYNEDFSVDFVALRLSMVLGPPGKPRGSLRIDEIIQSALRKEVAQISVDGDNKYESFYVKGAANVIYLALEAKNLEYRIFNTGSSEMYSLKEILNIVRKFIPEAQATFGTGRDFAYTTRGIFNIEEAEKIVNYHHH